MWINVQINKCVITPSNYPGWKKVSWVSEFLIQLVKSRNVSWHTSEGRVDLKCVDAYCTVDVYANVW